MRSVKGLRLNSLVRFFNPLLANFIIFREYVCLLLGGVPSNICGKSSMRPLREGRSVASRDGEFEVDEEASEFVSESWGSVIDAGRSG
jgi:hypothetical protein